ncbi:MAG: hypothetical protein ACXVB4_10055 [Pseudobdellovibrionaceae bacterium]
MRRLSLPQCLLLSFAVYIIVVTFNTGFIATDEYWDGITRYLPAQKASVASLVNADDVKSPLQILPLHAAAQLAYKLGIETPFNQYHFVIIFWGLLGFGLSALAALLLFRQKSENLAKVAVLLLGFHFAAPGLLTRPMFESLAAPWMALTCAFAVLYDEQQKLKPLLAGVFCASMAFTLRQQTGFCALVFMVLPLLHKQWKHLFLAGLAGLTFFVLSGLPDIFIRGSFHHSLRALAEYNFKHGADYGNRPWHFFFPLIFVCMFTPWLIAKYPPGFLKDAFKRYRSLYIILALFLILHSLFANKFERFLISMIPVMIFLLVPFVAYFLETASQRKYRLLSMLAVNLIFWLPASFFPAQKNITDLARYMDEYPQYHSLKSIDQSIEWIPDAFMRKADYTILQLSTAEFQKSEASKSCDYLIALNKKSFADNKEFLYSHYDFITRFDVNLIESIAYKLNPENNVRRSPLMIFGCKK